MTDDVEVLSKPPSEIFCSSEDTAEGVSPYSLFVELSKVERKSGVCQSTKLETSRETLSPAGPDGKIGKILVHSKPFGLAENDSETCCM